MIELPITIQTYSQGRDLVLWHPSWTLRRLRLRLIRESVWPLPFAAVVLGVSLFLLGVHTESNVIACLDVAGGIAAALAGVGHIALSLVLFLSGRDLPDSLTQVPGRHLYRLDDFTSLPEPVANLAKDLIVTIYRLHTNGAAAGLNPRLLRESHHAAWDALSCLDQTRTLRQWTTPGLCAASEIAAIDDSIGRTVRSLRHSAELAEAWRAKVTYLEHGCLKSAERSAAEIAEGVFAYVTAARDILGAGPFAWEQPPSRPDLLSALRLLRRQAWVHPVPGERHVL